MRLVDAGALLKHFETIQKQENAIGLDFVAIADEIKEQPTAYDPDKVVEQLNDKFRVVRTDEDLEWNRAIGKAIEIVKGGGVDGN